MLKTRKNYTNAVFVISFLFFVESSDFDGFIPTASLDGSHIPVAIVTQTSLDVLITGPAGTATTTVEITTPPLDIEAEELAVEPMDRDMTTTVEDLTTESDGNKTTSYLCVSQ